MFPGGVREITPELVQREICVSAGFCFFCCFSMLVGWSPGVHLSLGTEGLSTALSWESIYYCCPWDKGWVVVANGAGETPGASCSPLATSCKHQWQGWGAVAVAQQGRSCAPVS